MKVPFQDFKAAYKELKPDLDRAYRRFISSGWYVLGTEVSEFEKEYAAYCESDHCVGVGSGLDALHLAIRAANIGNDDEVIVASNTYIATWLGVTHAGATSVPVEPCPDTFNLDPDLLTASLTSKTKAILATNLYGQACDYDAISRFSKDHGLMLITDNAQAHGARYKGRRVGGLADIECHSFYPSKNLGAFGEAGAVTTNDPEIADNIRSLRNYGSRKRYSNERLGYNSRLDELQAAFLRMKLGHLDEWNSRRRVVANNYLSNLSDCGEQLRLPLVPKWAEPVWHLFVVRHQDRNRLKGYLEEKGIQSLIHYPIPPHMSVAYRSAEAADFFVSKRLPIAETLANEVLSLPIGPHMTDEQVHYVISSIQEFEC